MSPNNFLVQVKDVIWKRHRDQLKHRDIPLDHEQDRYLEKSEKPYTSLDKTDHSTVTRKSSRTMHSVHTGKDWRVTKRRRVKIMLETWRNMM